ncbi:MAG TPA: winged helix-turn-helix domain-containing protein [Steroidobacteraceae bacterium]|nr:winged helix-turn-helix domain-containing protein [Steroidobacteraceae bacterium]
MAFTRQQLQAGFRIGECLIEPSQNRIVRGGVEARLEPRVVDVLVCLAEHAGEVVSRETLNEKVWGNVIVTDQAVTNCISELRQHLGDDRAAHRVIETIPKRGYRLTAPVALIEHTPAAGQRRPFANRKMLLGVALLFIALSVGAWFRWRSSSPQPLTSVAVVRFENAARDEALDYLALALPDEIATLLIASQGLAVRPLGYLDGEDPVASARKRHVDHIVSGRYYLEDNGQLSLAVEAQHVEQERVIWRTRITLPAGDLLAMRERIAAGVQQGLLPALGEHAVRKSGSIPANAEAYQLYLRSIAFPQQPKPNERAIEMLEQAVALEPAFAPAWDALGRRYYDFGSWWGGAEQARQKSLAAHRKALELDPRLISAARAIVMRRVETGDHEGAYRDARQLLDQFGPGADTHFAISYVYRYGGMLENSQRHCELALDRDPQDPRLRSCAFAYLYAGELSRVMDFLELEEGSFFVHWGLVQYQLRLNGRDAALRVTRQAADEPTRRFMEPCLEGARGADLEAPAAEFIQHWQRSEDPEPAHAMAALLVFCGRTADALRFVERAVDGGFCSYPSIDLDPIWAGLRGDPEFQRIRGKAMTCEDRFRRMVEAYDKVGSKP